MAAWALRGSDRWLPRRAGGLDPVVAGLLSPRLRLGSVSLPPVPSQPPSPLHPLKNGYR